jgi:nucleoside-diphosphate-sugar epimerase
VKVLVTGLGGFTGHYVKVELEKLSYDVIGLESDLTDAKGLKSEIDRVRPNKVVHLAAIASVDHGSINEFYNVNLIGTRNLLEALESQGGGLQSVLLASSANIYGNKNEGVLAETALPNPCNDYAVSKYAMEQMAFLWKERLPIFLTRPFNYTGVGQGENFLIPKIVSHFKQRKDVIELGNIDVNRDFNDVRMVAKCYCQLLEKPPIGEVVNICTGKVHSLKNIIEICQQLTGHKINIKVNPLFVRANEVRTLVGDTSKLIKLTGTSEMISLEETLQWMLEATPCLE